MTNETPQTIRAWIDETFPNSSQRARVRRSVKEWLELDEALERGASADVIAAEAADVAITACGWARLPEIAGESFGCNESCLLPIGHPGLMYTVNRAMADADFWTLIMGLASIIGSYAALQSAINAKMQINRARSWDIAADGTGQHRPGNSLGAQLNDAALQIRTLSDKNDALKATVEKVRALTDRMCVGRDPTRYVVSCASIFAILNTPADEVKSTTHGEG